MKERREAPKKDKHGLPLYIDVALVKRSTARPPGSSSSSSYSSRSQQARLTERVKARDRGRCVITGVRDTGRPCYACHLLPGDNERRQIPCAWHRALWGHQLSTAEYGHLRACISAMESQHPRSPRRAEMRLRTSLSDAVRSPVCVASVYSQVTCFVFDDDVYAPKLALYCLEPLRCGSSRAWCGSTPPRPRAYRAR